MNTFIFLLQVVGLIAIIAMAFDCFNQTKKMRAHNERVKHFICKLESENERIKKLVREIESDREKNLKTKKSKKK